MNVYPPGALERVQAIQLDILKAVAILCEECDITWFAEGGTCLGAVRHKGFIPWDDDIDIAMPWDDFKRFCEVAPLVLEGTDYGLYTHQTTPNYPPLFAKVYKRGTRFIGEQMLEADFEEGIFIDIFAYAQLDSDKRIAARQVKELHFWQGVSYTREIRHPFLAKTMPLRPLVAKGLAAGHTLLQFITTPELIDREFSKVIERGNAQGDWIDVFFTQAGLLTTGDLFPLTYGTFEDMEVPLPHNTDRVLSLLYGNYMEVPPEEDRFTKPPRILDFGDGVNVIAKQGLDEPKLNNTASADKVTKRPIKKAPGQKIIDAAAVHQTNNVDSDRAEQQLQKLHDVLLMMLKDFAKLCKEEDLVWIASYGTAIGALRHKGFIPWDDDIDICMPRTDLERLTERVCSDPDSRYEIINSQRYPNYPLATTRFCLKGTVFKDGALLDARFPSGIFIDLFPLDTLSNTPTTFYKQVYGSWFFNKLALAKEFSNPTIVRAGVLGSIMKMASAGAHKLLHSTLLQNYNPNDTAYKLLMTCSDQDPKRMGYPCDTFPLGCLYNTNDLFPVQWVPFEDIEIPIAAAAEKLLDEYYGNWEELPPYSARQLHFPEVLDFGPYK